MPAFSGQEELAFISSGTVWLLGGTPGALRELPVPSGFEPFSPMLSPDGRWLAYIAVRSTNTSFQAELWLAHGDGTGAHLVRDVLVGGVGDVAWSPAADLLAVVTQGGRLPNAVDLVSPEAAVRQVFALSSTKIATGYVEDAEWSSSGGTLAVSTVDFGPGGSSAVRAYPVGGGAPKRWFSIKNTETLPDICTGCGGGDVIADLAGWWPGWGIGFWVFSSGMTHNNDDTPLEVVSGPGARPHLIGATLSDGETVALAAAGNGSLAIVDSTGGREIGSSKQVETCQPASRTCTAVPGASTWTGPDLQSCGKPWFTHPAAGAPGSGVTLDPAWSPDGAYLAYVKAPIAFTGAWPSLAWYQAHDLMVWDSHTHTSRRIAGVSGASVPVWSNNGNDLLFAKEDALWLVADGPPVEVAGPLYPEAQWQSAYEPDGRSRSARSGSPTTARSLGRSSSTGGRPDPGDGRSTRRGLAGRGR